jgi:EpsI family protein
MSRSNNRKITVLFILAVITIAVSWKFYFQEYIQKDTVDIRGFPMEINGWKGEEIPISENDYAILETHNVFARNYTSPSGQTVMLYIAYSQTNRKVVHPPEICYVGGGNLILSKNVDTVRVGKKNLDVNKLYLEQGDLDQMLYYWFKAGPFFTASYVQQQINTVFNTLRGRKDGSALIRISAVVKDKNTKAAERDIQAFIHAILPSTHQYII